MRGATIPLFPLYIVMAWNAIATPAFLYDLRIMYLQDVSSIYYGVRHPSAFVVHFAPHLTQRVNTTLIERH